MKINALYDKEGRILAAVQVETSRAVASPAPQPVPKRGQRVGVFTVPKECGHLSFQQACVQLMVKSEGKNASLVPKP